MQHHLPAGAVILSTSEESRYLSTLTPTSTLLTSPLKNPSQQEGNAPAHDESFGSFLRKELGEALTNTEKNQLPAAFLPAPSF